MFTKVREPAHDVLACNDFILILLLTFLPDYAKQEVSYVIKARNVKVSVFSFQVLE